MTQSSQLPPLYRRGNQGSDRLRQFLKIWRQQSMRERIVYNDTGQERVCELGKDWLWLEPRVPA